MKLKTVSRQKKVSYRYTVLAIGLISYLSLPVKALTFSEYPLGFGSSSTTPNILILYDNSMSMDYQMDFLHYIGGNDPQSRSNIIRPVIRSMITGYRTAFNWGVETFDLSSADPDCADNNGLCGNFTNYEGSSSTMVFTHTCINGISSVNAGLKCITNPEPNGYNYITYEKGDVGNSSSVIGSYNKKWIWGARAVGDSSGYLNDLFESRNTSTSTWKVSNDLSTTFNGHNDFKNAFFGHNPINFNTKSLLPRQLYINTGFVYKKQVTGLGKILEPIANDSDSHFNAIMNVFANETLDPNGYDIKNGAMKTPLVGSFITAQQYFSGDASPIQYGCQKNLIILAADSKPTADENGNAYAANDMSNSDTGKAYTDIYTQIQSLRTTLFRYTNHDIQTFVVGIGDMIYDPVSVNGLNKMASYGGTDAAYLATDSTGIANAFQRIIDSVRVQIPISRSNGHIALNASIGVSNINVYKTYFSNSGSIWEGNLTSAVPTVSVVNNIAQYNTGATPLDYSVGAAKWLVNDKIDGNSRQIITSILDNSGAKLVGVPFQWQSLDDATKNGFFISPETSDIGIKRLNYVRGDRSNEVSVINPTGFRSRSATVLGDIIDSSPVYVGTSSFGFSNSDFPVSTPSYANFVSETFLRRPMVYVGANDGMLHGFDANTLKEVFSYIPNSVMSKFKAFSNPAYEHTYFVNETPIIMDVPVAGKWMTQLIGFPGVGGTGLFALNITFSSDSLFNLDLSRAEANVRNIVLWELNSKIDPDIGYILNRGQKDQQRTVMSKQIGRMSNKRWAIVTGNGYNSPNNSTGLVISYLDASGGIPLYKKIMIDGETGGLSTPTLVDVDYDGIVDYAYAGDLKGNVWRFNLKGDENKWSAFHFYTPPPAFDPSNGILPAITTAPAITFHCSKAGLMIIVGTGKLLENSDNYIYNRTNDDFLLGLWDKFDNHSISLNDLQGQSYYWSGLSFINPNENVRSIANNVVMTTDNSVDWNNRYGWALRLLYSYPKKSRIVVPPYIKDGIVYFNTITTSAASSCNADQLLNTIQALDACTGARPKVSVFDINFDGKIDDHDKYNLAGTLVNVTGVYLQDTSRVVDSSVMITPAQAKCATPPCPLLKTGFIDPVSINLFDLGSRRLSWKELDQ